MDIVNLLKNHWVEIGVALLGIHTLLKGIRDAIDKTPQSDDNVFEKFVSLSGKILGYLFGKRPINNENKPK